MITHNVQILLCIFSVSVDVKVPFISVILLVAKVLDLFFAEVCAVTDFQISIPSGWEDSISSKKL